MSTRSGLDVEPIIGLEVHVQLATQTKMFCACRLAPEAEPNSCVCPVCLGLPGALPTINQHAVELGVRAGLALKCPIASQTRWDRKNYFYPDLPKNYQISQLGCPLAGAGLFEFPFDERYSRVRIRRAHLEEDAGKSIHDYPGFTAVDFNRAGTPLLEIVTEPDLHSADEVRAMGVQLQRLVRYLGVSSANMQQGQMRFEPNVNVRIRAGGQEYRTPIVEIKNLNSFRALRSAVSYEIERQVEDWERTGATAEAGNKSNRGWDDERGVTVPQREKEEAHDYRYFPDPDLPPLTVPAAMVADLRDQMPELPVHRSARFVHEFKLPPNDVHALVDDLATANLVDHAAESGGHKVTLGRHLLSFWLHHANERGVTIAALGISPGRLAELANLVASGRIGSTAAARVAEVMLTGHGRPAAIAEQLGLLQVDDEERVGAWVDEVLSANGAAVQDALSNPKKLSAARGFLTGRVMKASGGRANPQVVERVIEQRLFGLGDG